MPQPDDPEQPVEGGRTRVGPPYVVADVDPLDVDGTRTVAVGAALFLLGFLVLLPFRAELADAGRGWWLWTCLVGFGLGIIGMAYCRRRRGPRQPGG